MIPASEFHIKLKEAQRAGEFLSERDCNCKMKMNDVLGRCRINAKPPKTSLTCEAVTVQFNTRTNTIFIMWGGG